jgi:hypothetical protein
MPREEFSSGLEIIASTAKDYDLLLGSRALDISRGVARLSFEKNVAIAGRHQMRSPTFEFSREYIDDLSGTPRYRKALATFLESLSLRLPQPQPQQFMTLSGVPIDLEIHWPFREVQTSDDSFVHVLARVGSPWSNEANFTVLLSGLDEYDIGPSLSPPTMELFVVNAIRAAIDAGEVDFYRIGSHPATLQQVRISPSKSGEAVSDHKIKEYLRRKVYWLGFREGDAQTRVALSDPYDMHYLKQTPQRVRQLAVVMQANGELWLDETLQFAAVTSKLLQQSDVLENELSAGLARDSKSSDAQDSGSAQATTAAPTVFISYSSEDSHFARSLSKALKERRIGVWFDEQEIRVGDSLIAQIGEALHVHDFMIIVLSPASVKSQWVQKELAEAMVREIKQKRVVILPVIYRQCEIPPFLTDKKYADFTGDSDSALNLLVHSIERHHASSTL